MISPAQQPSPHTGFGSAAATAPQPESEAPELIKPASGADETTNKTNADANANASKAEAEAKQAAEESTSSAEDMTEAARELIEKIKSQSRPSQRDLSFEVDEDEKSVVISVINSDTREVIRTIPNEEFVASVGAEFIESGHLFSSEA